MTRTYTRMSCFWCGKEHGVNARTSHLRKHVREGFLVEITTYPVKGDRRFPFVVFKLTDPGLWKETYPARSNCGG
jgi:DNA mismatch repair protein MutH